MDDKHPIITNDLSKGMSQATIPSSQLPNTYRYMLNGQKDYYGGNTTGRGKEQSIVLDIEMPEDITAIDWLNQSEKDRFIIFSYNYKEEYSELGIADRLSKTYTRVLTDKEDKFGGKFHFNCNEDISSEIKPQKMKDGCYHSILYFSSKFTYYKIDLDSKLCNKKHSDFYLFQCYCTGSVKSNVIKNGGERLQDGTYRIFTRLEDSSGNVTNYFKIGNFIHIWGKNGVPGEITKDAIELTLSGADTTYTYITIGVAKTVAKVTRFYKLVTLPYHGNEITYLYTGAEDVIEISPDEVLEKKDGYIRGKSLFQKDRRLVLYEILPDYNVNLQKLVSDAKLSWVEALIEFKDADKYKSYARGELGSYAAVFNFCDGTSTNAFPFIGRKATKADRKIIKKGENGNCTECDLQTWQVKNTAYVTKKYCNVSLKGDLTPRGSITKDTVENSYSRWVKFTDNEKHGYDNGITTTNSPNDMLKEYIGILGNCVTCGNLSDLMINTPCRGCIGADGTTGGCGGKQCAAGPCYCKSGCCGGGGTGGCAGGGCGNPLLSNNYNPNTANPREATEQQCTVDVVYMKSPGFCSYCDAIDASTVIDRLGDIVGPDYTITTSTIVNPNPPTGGWPCFQVTCGANIFLYRYSNFKTDADAKNTINYACPCGDVTPVDPNGNGDNGGGCGGGCGSGGSGGCGGSVCGGCTSCEGCNKTCVDCAKDTNTGPYYSGALRGEVVNPGKYKGTITTGKYICSTSRCSKPDDWTDDGVCKECGEIGGFAHTNGGQEYRLEYFAAGRSSTSIDPNDIKYQVESNIPECSKGKPIYDASGCRIVGYEPVIIQEGEFGVWESLEGYPEIEDCNGNPLYGENKGCPIRHHMWPGEDISPYHVTDRDGVVSDAMPENVEWGRTKYRILCLKVTNLHIPIEIRESLPKPLCPKNPISIVEQPIGFGKRILGKGMMTHTFKATLGNQDYACPKNGINSLELFDKYNDVPTGGPVTHYRGGQNINAPIYNLHSPDLNFREVPLNADRVYCPWEITGEGQRYETYAQGERVRGLFDSGMLHRGARQSINMNKYKRLGYPTGKKNICCEKVNLNLHLFITPHNLLAKKNKWGSIDIRWEFDGNSILSITSGTIVIESTITDSADSPPTILTHTETIQFNNNQAFGSWRNVISANKIIWSNFTRLDVKYTVQLNANGGCRYTGEFETADRIDPIAIGGNQKLAIESYQHWSLDSSDCSIDDVEDKRFFRCVKEITYLDTDSVLDKTGDFTYPILNYGREKSVVMELEGEEYKLTSGIDKFLTDNKYNGLPSGDLRANATCDGSFMGDLDCRSCNIHNAAAHWGILINDDPKHYGRLENAIYHSIGFDMTWDEMVCGRAQRVGLGNKWMGMYTHKRFSFVSDKIGNLDEQRVSLLADSVLELFEQTVRGIGFIQLFPNLTALFCLYTCTAIPSNCNNDGDPRKRRGLREFVRRTCWNGVETFAGLTNRDTYHSNAQVTLTHTHCESSVQLQHRQIGECDFIRVDKTTEELIMNKAEVHYGNNTLKCLQLDPEFRKGTSWRKAFLTRNGYKWPKTPTIMTVIKVLIKIIILIMLSKWIIDTFADMKVEAFGFSIPIGVFIVIIWFLLVLFADKLNYKVCYMIDALLDIQECKIECYSANGTNCKVADNDMLPVEENYTEYNWDHSKENSIETFFAPGRSYDTCKCNEISNRSVYSDPQGIDSIDDAWQNYRPNNYNERPIDKGVINDMFEDNGKVIAHTPSTYMVIDSQNQTLQTGEGNTILLGKGNFLNVAVAPYGGTEEGYAGCKDPYASLTCKYGHFFIDREYPGIFKFSGQPTELADAHLYHTIREHLGFKILTQFPDYKQIGQSYAVGYAIGFDPRLNRLLITKRDYKAINPDSLRYIDGLFYVKDTNEVIDVDNTQYFIDMSFTASYDLHEKEWISFHSYKPYMYLHDRNHLYSMGPKGIYVHSKAKTFLEQYDEVKPWIIDLVMRSDQVNTILALDKIEINTESIGYVDNEVFRKDIFFNHIAIYNSHQSTGEQPINVVTKVSDKNPVGVFEILKNEKTFTLSQIKDKVGIKNVPYTIENTTEVSVFSDINNKIISRNNIGIGTFTDNYAIIRLKYTSKDSTDINLIIKSIIAYYTKT